MTTALATPARKRTKLVRGAAQLLHEQGFQRTTLALNNKYELDGRDANSFANIAWIFGLHDRPWPSRAIYGAVRCMTSKSARSKLDLPTDGIAADASFLGAIFREPPAESRDVNVIGAPTRGWPVGPSKLTLSA